MASERNRTEEKKTYTVGEIAEMLGISDKVAYTLVKSGQQSSREKQSIPLSTGM